MELSQIYNQFERLENLPNVLSGTIGKSTLGFEIPFFHVGNPKGQQILVECAIHAREYVTCLVAIKQIEFLSTLNLPFGIFFVPLVNPDGVGIVLQGTQFEALDSQKKLQLILINQSIDFSLWKANANAVDLNVHFDALWGKGAHNVFEPAPANYVGQKPCDQVEAVVLRNFAQKLKPCLSLSYHTRGQVVFWGFEALNKKQLKRDKAIGKAICAYNGYKLVKTVASTGGFSDYMSLLDVPAFTVEFGSDKLAHPIGAEHAQAFFEQNKLLPIVAYDALQKYQAKTATK